MKLYLKNKLISFGGSSTVTDANGVDQYIVKGNLITITKKKQIKSIDGEVLYKVRDKYWHFIQRSAFVCDSKGKKLLKIKTKGALGQNMSVKSNIDDIDIEFGGWFKGINKILIDGEVVCIIHRVFNMIVDSFEIDICNDEVDPALMLAIAVAIDNMRDGDSKS